MTSTQKNDSASSGLPPIIIVQTTRLPCEPGRRLMTGDEEIIVTFERPTVRQAIRQVRLSSMMLARAVGRGLASYVGRIERGYIHRQNNP
jgi:hypothetical protein